MAERKLSWFMKDDIRYSEFLFLRALERRDPKFEYIFISGPEQQNIPGLHQIFYLQMPVASAEDGYINFEQQNLQLLIGRLRGEIAPDFEEDLRRSVDVPVSMLCLDMDNFKKINDDSGHAAGDVVMKAYLEAVRDSLGSFGNAYRGRGDEVAALIVGQEHKRATEIAEKIRVSVETLRCELNDTTRPTVTASIGVATTPPESRGMDMETLADDRQNRAKKEGKNRVV